MLYISILALTLAVGATIAYFNINDTVCQNKKDTDMELLRRYDKQEDRWIDLKTDLSYLQASLQYLLSRSAKYSIGDYISYTKAPYPTMYGGDCSLIICSSVIKSVQLNNGTIQYITESGDRVNEEGVTLMCCKEKK